MDVRVRFEAAMLGHRWHDEVTVTRTELVDNLVAGGKLTLLDQPVEEDPADGQDTPTVPPSEPVAAPEAAPQVDAPTPATGVGWFANPAES